MRRPLLFYTIDDTTDDIKYCKKRGFVPHKTVFKQLDGKPFPVVIQYSKKGYIYDALESDQCYSGYMVTLVRLPQLTFSDLLDVALTSKHLSERAGAIGMILKKHPKEFESYLMSISQRNVSNRITQKQISRMTTFIYDFVREHTSYVGNMTMVLSLCEKFSRTEDSLKPLKKS